MPVYASAQSSDRITVLDTFGDYDRGDSLFIYGHVAIVDDSFLITLYSSMDMWQL